MELDQITLIRDEPGPQSHENSEVTTASTIASSSKTSSSKSKDDMGMPRSHSSEKKLPWPMLHSYPGKSRTRNTTKSTTKTSSYPQSKDDLCPLDLPIRSSMSSEKKLSWLQSQIIGGDAEFDSPFGKRKLIFADHAASGRSLLYIEDYIINSVLPFYGNPYNYESHVGQRTTKMLHEASGYIKRCLGGRRDDAIMFCGSGSTVAIKKLQEFMGVAVAPILRERLIKYLKNEERWVVFIGPYEHHSNVLSWRQSLAEVVEIGVDDNDLINIEQLRLQLESNKNTNRPILGFFSACSNVTGIYSNTRSIARLLHQYGGFTCFDFTASGPYVEIDMRAGETDGYDAILLSPDKFLGGPGSPAILLISKAIYQLSSYSPSTGGGGTVNHSIGNEKDTLYLDDLEKRENGGTPQVIQTIRAALAFWVKEYIGYEVIKGQEDIYIQRALERLLPNQNIKVLGNTSTKRHAILSFLIYSTTNSSQENMVTNKRDKPLHGSFVATLLNDLFGIQARGECDHCVGPSGHNLFNFHKIQSDEIRSAILKGYVGVKPGWTRISFPYYMLNEEFEFILTAVEFISLYGQQFLALYNFNFETGRWCLEEELKNLIGKRKNKSVHFKPLASSIKEIGLPKEYLYTADVKNLQMIDTYGSYLETARQIASQLPKFPPHRSLPEGIDLNILQFRI